MTFIIGRGFAELQILKKWKWPYLLKDKATLNNSASIMEDLLK